MRRPRRIGEPDRQFRGIHTVEGRAPPPTVIQVGQRRFGPGPQTQQLGGPQRTLFRAAQCDIGRTDVDRGIGRLTLPQQPRGHRPEHQPDGDPHDHLSP